MARRTRYLLPAAIVLAVLAGRATSLPLALLVLLGLAAAAGIDVIVRRAEQRRLRLIADQVSAFAAELTTPAPAHAVTGAADALLRGDGDAEWLRTVAALREVAVMLRSRVDALQSDRDRVERVLDAIPAAVLVFSDGVLGTANPAARTMFGIGTDTEPVSPLRALGVQGLADAVVEVAETGRDVEVEVTRDGRELIASGSRVVEGEVALVVSDVTDVRRVEAMRRDFVANASHELKTPVAGMQALADSVHLALERDPDRARRMVAHIQDEATRLGRLVRELLDLTRLEEQTATERRRVDVAALAARQVERVQGLASKARVTVDCRAEPGLAVVGVPADLELVVGNLIENAITYNGPGGHVEVDVRRETGDVVVEVSDTGIGIPVADQDRIFERFYRVDRARSRAAGGTGLGLSIVRHAVERHGGSIRVASVLGEGSSFTVRLPVDGGGDRA